MNRAPRVALAKWLVGPQTSLAVVMMPLSAQRRLVLIEPPND